MRRVRECARLGGGLHPVQGECSMDTNLRQDRLHDAAVALLAAEREIHAALRKHEEASTSFPEGSHALNNAAILAHEHQEALQAYLADTASSSTSDRLPADVVMTLARNLAADMRTPADALQAGNALLAGAALSYGALFEMALKLYEPPLRQLAPRCLKEYMTAAAGLAALVPRAVADQLHDDGLDCLCICPMCGIGACGCVELARQTLQVAWREAVDGEQAAGFPLQPPREDSPLSKAGVTGGERLYEIDGQPAESIPGMQAALRKHALGDSVRMLVGRDRHSAREITVKHVSDYPSG